MERLARDGQLLSAEADDPAQPRCALDAASTTIRAEAGRAHRQFHIEDAARREAERRPTRTLIEADGAKLAIVESDMGLDRILAGIAHRRAGLVPADEALNREESDAAARKVKLQGESKELPGRMDSLVEKYKVTR